MTLAPGVRLGPYEILAPLGRGGMGEVWRARDTRLGRDVAIKSLPADLVTDPERLARFEREARTLASLNHAHIAAIYGVETVGESMYLVLECVEGETLAERLAAGPIPQDEALELGRQIALALEAAHEAGVIHRDLKPANVKIRPDATVKLLDFGLAKIAEPSGSSPNLTHSPTLTTPATRTGVILGTAAYMSPEQARGKPLDKRTDIFSFGCVLYECLTGRTAFEGESVSDTLAAILKSEPNWTALPAGTPARVRDLLRRCLAKDPARRLRDIADARLDIEDTLSGPAVVAPASSPRGEARHPGGASWLLWIVAGALLGALAATALWRFSSSRISGDRLLPVRSTIPLPADTRLTVGNVRPSLAFSPDGSKLVFRAVQGGVNRLYVRALDRSEATPIAGSEGGFNPFFSPDGEWLGFFTLRELKKVSLAGGSSSTIAIVPPVTQGGTWTPDGSILFTWSVNGGLSWVPSAGGTPQPLTILDASGGEHAHAWPQILPDGKNLLIVVRAGRDFDDVANSNVVIHSLATGNRRVLVANAAFARYVPPGYILFTRGTTVLAARCDPNRWELTGPAVPVLENLLTSAYDQVPFAAASASLLVSVPGERTAAPAESLVWVNRSGRQDSSPLPLPPAFFLSPSLSPDGKRLAVAMAEQSEGAKLSIAVYDFDRRVLSRLTPGPGRSFCPVWSPDGKRLAFSRFLVGNPQTCWRAADGSGDVEVLTPGGVAEFPTSWSADGHSLAYARGGGTTLENMDIWMLSVDGRRELKPWLATPSREYAPFFSADGRWIAYDSDESGRNEIYVRPYPGPGGQTKISSNGGIEPAWSADGREIFYRSPDQFMSVPVRTSPEFSAGAAHLLFPDPYTKWGREDAPRSYAVAPDGSRFLFIKRGEAKQTSVTQLNLISNWTAELDRAAAAKR